MPKKTERWDARRGFGGSQGEVDLRVPKAHGNGEGLEEGADGGVPVRDHPRHVEAGSDPQGYTGAKVGPPPPPSLNP